MVRILLKPQRSEIHYRCTFESPAFELLSSPAPLYRALLSHLSPFGANLQNLQGEFQTVGNSNVSCALLELNSFVRVRLERLEIDFWKTHELSTETIHGIVLAGLTAIQNVAPSVELDMHVVELSVLAGIEQESYSSLLARYVKVPDGLSAADTGVAFYSRRDPETQSEWGNVIVDRVLGQDQATSIRISVGLKAAEVDPKELATSVDRYIRASFAKLGLEFQRQDQK